MSVFRIIYALNRANHRSRTTCTGFLERSKFFFSHRTTFHLHAHIFGQLHQALIGNGWQNGSRQRSNISIIFYSEEVGSAALVDVLLLLCIQIKLCGIPCRMCFVAGTQTGCIVTTDFINTSSKRSSTVILTCNDIRSSCKTAFKVRTYRSNKYQEHIFIGRTHPHLCPGSNQQRTDIKGSTALVRRYKAFVHFHRCQHSFFETFCRQFCHHDTTTRRLQAGSILFQTENTHLTIFATECL